MRLIGFDKELFQLILEEVQNHLDDEKAKNPISKLGIKSELNTTNHLLLKMRYLKNCLTFFDLGFYFGISESYASIIFRKYKEILHGLVVLKM